MSIYYHAFHLGELYEAIGSRDQKLLQQAEARLSSIDPELLVVVKAILQDGLLYHELFSHDLYNRALNKLVPLLPSSHTYMEEKDYQIDYHDAWRKLPRHTLLRTYWGYLTHGRYLFDHEIQPLTNHRYGYLSNDELPQFLRLVEKEGERLPWYFFQQTSDAIRQTYEAGADLYVTIQIKGRRFRMTRPSDRQSR